MGKLKAFNSLDEKKRLFKNISDNFFVINTKQEFDEWFKFYTSNIKEKKKTDFIFRGMGDASYKLYTSAQRIWIQNDMKEWSNKRYLEFINDMIQRAKKYPLLQKVFDIYGYSEREREFPILSILQHYWAPTPLMDFTHNLNVALFFATENLKSGYGHDKISDYFSIYRIDKSNYRNEFLHIREIDYGRLNSFETFMQTGDSLNNRNSNAIYYLSDFDEGNSYDTTPNSVINIIDSKPATSIYNQNIIPQEGLFVFNPFSEKTIDDVFNVEPHSEGSNLVLSPFSCFNIKKDLADYVRRHIKEKYQIDKSFIYPHLYDDADKIKNFVLNNYAKY